MAYDTLSAAISDLRKNGYTTDFNTGFDCIVCHEPHPVSLPAEEFEIVAVHRFEGESNPSDESVLYVIESKDKQMKGLLVNAFGIYADNLSDKMLKKLSFNRRPAQ